MNKEETKHVTGEPAAQEKKGTKRIFGGRKPEDDSKSQKDVGKIQLGVGEVRLRHDGKRGR
jgi:hypothetical protein